MNRTGCVGDGYSWRNDAPRSKGLTRMTGSNAHAERSPAAVTVPTPTPPRRRPRRRDDLSAYPTLTADELLAKADEFAKAIRQILMRLHDVAWLAAHPLAVPAARARQNQNRRNGRSPRPPVEAPFTPEYLGESLAERVRSAIRNLEPSTVRRRASAAKGALGLASTPNAVGLDGSEMPPANDAVSGAEPTNAEAPDTAPHGSDSLRQRVERAARRAKIMRLRYIENQDIPAIIASLNIGRSEYFRLQADGSTMVAEFLRRAWDTSVRTPGDHAPASPRPEGILAVTPDLRTGNVTRFIGREKEIAEVAHLISTSRLITILGAPGAGKTRLALEVARHLSPTFGGGTVVISLADLDDESRVLPAIGRAFDIYDVSSLELEYYLVTALQDRPTLVVLDNFEHLLGAGVQVARLVAGVPSLSVITTSRVPLGVVGEQRFTLDPLPLPDVNARDGDAAPLQTNPAVNLFIDRARSIDPGFPHHLVDLHATVNICRVLDGLPLSIELAAARLATLTAPAILNRLHQTGSLNTVATGPRNAPSRHQTLHDAISWSRGLLSDDEARTLGTLSAFVGGASLPAILSVALGADDVDPGTPEALAAFNRLEALVLHNLVRRQAMADGSTRYGMLEAVRAYGLELLENDNTAEAVQSRHAAYFARQGHRHAPHMRGGVSNRLIQEIDLDLPNTRAALTYYLESAQPIPALELVANLEGFWWLQGYRVEGFTWLERTLAAAGDALPSQLRARALVMAGHLCALNGEDMRAHPFLLEGFAVAQESGERSAERDALHHLGVLARARGSDDEASQRWQACMRIAAETGDFYREGISLWHLGMLAYDRHDADSANEWLDAARTIFERHDQVIGIGLVQPTEGQVAMATGDSLDARRLIEGAIRSLELHGSATGMMYALAALAELEYLDGNLDEAYDAAERSIALMNGLGQPRGVARNLVTLGHVVTALGDLGRARHVYVDALRRSVAQGRIPNVAGALIGLAGLVIAETRNYPERRNLAEAEASRLLTAANALTASIGRTAKQVEWRHQSRWLADIAPATATPTVAQALRTARALAATTPLAVTPLPASG